MFQSLQCFPSPPSALRAVKSSKGKPKHVTWASTLLSSLLFDSMQPPSQCRHVPSEGFWHLVTRKRKARAPSSSIYKYTKAPHQQRRFSSPSSYKSSLHFTCYRCGDRGHMASCCRNVRVCPCCGGLGHFAFSCTTTLPSAADQPPRRHSTHSPARSQLLQTNSYNNVVNAESSRHQNHSVPLAPCNLTKSYRSTPAANRGRQQFRPCYTNAHNNNTQPCNNNRPRPATPQPPSRRDPSPTSMSSSDLPPPLSPFENLNTTLPKEPPATTFITLKVTDDILDTVVEMQNHAIATIISDEPTTVALANELNERWSLWNWHWEPLRAKPNTFLVLFPDNARLEQGLGKKSMNSPRAP